MGDACQPAEFAKIPASAQPIVGVWMVDEVFRIEVTSDAKGVVSAEVSNNGTVFSPLGSGWSRGTFWVLVAPPAVGMSQTFSFSPKGSQPVKGTFVAAMEEQVDGRVVRRHEERPAKVNVRRVCP